MKKLFGLLFIALILIVPTAKAADKEPVNIYLFHGSTCPHCQELIEWFEKQEDEYGDKYNLIKYEVWENENNSKLLSLTAEYLDLDTSSLGVPFMLIGEEQFSGFDPNEDPEAIIKAIEEEYDKDPSDRVNVVDKVIEESNWKSENNSEKEKKKNTSNLIVGIVTIVVVVAIVALVIKAREE